MDNVWGNLWFYVVLRFYGRFEIIEFGVLSWEEEAIGADCDRLAWVSWYEVCYRNHAVFSAKISTELLNNDYLLDVFNSPRRHASLFPCFYVAFLG